MGKAKRSETEPSFEDNLRRLERILEQLENGNIPLEESLQMYEEGVLLSRKCMDILDQAEKKLKILSRELPGIINHEEG